MRPGPDRARRIALTGGIATGKSYVRAAFDALGVPTIDADREARAAVAPGTDGWRAVRARFGEGIVGTDGEINRKALGAIVFADADARRGLEAIIHPIVRRAIDAWFASLAAADSPFGIADIPLLFETGRQAEFDGVIVAACSPDIQLQRLIERDALTPDAAQRRVDAQLPIEDKARLADWVIRTDTTFADTTAQVRATWQLLRLRYTPRGGGDRPDA
jgi:dephospho-CoA kinase